ncbi:MAG: hypothetical protein IT494_04725 [Gammaproteobacteria bacterium]|nr:hypothetical protein [Gammaproteobacteria bacterium]
MKNTNTLGRLAFGAALLGMTGAASAATVSFTNIDDADGLAALFDPATTTPSGNTINFGINAFEASTSFGLFTQATDTMVLTINAPDGYKITKITYSEGGSGSSSGGGISFAVASVIINGSAIEPISRAFLGGSGSWDADTSVSFTSPLTSAVLSVTNTLAAFGGGGGAIIAKEWANVEANIAPVPVPPAVWMLASAIVGLVTIGRRKAA